jgi:hypothetical protein
VTSFERHSSFRIGDGSIHISDRGDAPAAFVMLRTLQLSPGIAQKFQSPSHMGLVRPHRIQTHGRNRNDDNDTNP